MLVTGLGSKNIVANKKVTVPIIVEKTDIAQVGISMKNVRKEECQALGTCIGRNSPGLESRGRKHQNNRHSYSINVFTLLCSLR